MISRSSSAKPHTASKLSSKKSRSYLTPRANRYYAATGAVYGGWPVYNQTHGNGNVLFFTGVSWVVGAVVGANRKLEQ